MNDVRIPIGVPEETPVEVVRISDKVVAEALRTIKHAKILLALLCLGTALVVWQLERVREAIIAK